MGIIRIFLAHNRDDRARVLEIYHGLHSPEFDCWIDKYRIGPGDDFAVKIDQALKSTDVVLVFWGKTGLGKFQRKEVSAALVEEGKPNRRLKMIAVLLDDAIETDGLPFFLKTRHWLDLRENQSNRISTEQLIDELKEACRDIDHRKTVDAMAAKLLEHGFKFESKGLKEYLEDLAFSVHKSLFRWEVEGDHQEQDQPCDCSLRKRERWIQLAFMVGLTRQQVKVLSMIPLLQVFLSDDGTVYKRSEEYGKPPEISSWAEANAKLNALTSSACKEVDSLLIPLLEEIDNHYDHLSLTEI